MTRSAQLYRLSSLVRLLFGFVWLVDASYKWRPAFRLHVVGLISDAAKGQPAWLVPWFALWHSLFSWQPAFFAYSVAIGETYIALAVLFGFARKVTCALGAICSILIWSTSEGFGLAGIPVIAGTPVVTDVGTAIIYALVFLGLLALDARAGTRPYSLDAVLERWLPWWRGIAEVRR